MGGILLCATKTCGHAHADSIVKDDDGKPVALAKVCSRCECKKFKK